MARKVKLHVNVNKVNELEFKMGSNIKTLDVNDVKKLKQILDNFIEYTEYWKYYIDYYRGYTLKKIKNVLDQYEKDHKNRGEEFYSIGENFAAFLDIIYEDNSETGIRIADNDTAATVIKSMYEQKYGKKHTLEFDPESSYCYIYTSDKREAERFMWWSYKEIIKPTLDKIKRGEK